MVVARPKTIRAINAELVTGLLLDSGWASRATLARWTGLSKPSVAEVVDQLVEAGVLLKRDTGARTREYSVDSGRTLAVAVSISVAAVEMCIVDAAGTVVGGAWRPHDATEKERDPDRVISRMIDVVLQQEGLAPDPHHDVIVGVAASFDERSQQLRHAGWLPFWTRAAVASVIADAEQRGGAAVIENDVKLALVAERQARSLDRDDQSMCLVWLGPAVGLASWANGALVRGASGGGGEISYMPAAGGQLSDSMGAMGLAVLGAQLGIPGADATAIMATAAAGDSDEARRFLDAVVGRLAPAVANIVTVLDPGLVVVGGPIGESGGAQLAARVEKKLSELVPIACDVEVSIARGDAVLDGATLLAAQHARLRLLESARLVGAPADRIDA